MTNPFFFLCLLCLFLAFNPFCRPMIKTFFFLCPFFRPMTNPFFFLPLPASISTFQTANYMGNKRLEKPGFGLQTAKVQQSCYNALSAFGAGRSQCFLKIRLWILGWISLLEAYCGLSAL
jgi:hypothetical protein